MKPHKHADILRAIADGKEVQFKHRISHAWVTPENVNPISNPEVEWRVKPEPKPDFFVEECVLYSTYHGAFFDDMPSNNIRLTFDGETGKLKKAEVIE